MSLLWIMVGLTLIGVGLLILNLWVLKKHQSADRRRKLELSLDKEAIFQRNCEHFQLSAREAEVLRRILAGDSYQTVADALFISKKTVDTHMQNIFFKTGVRNRLGLLNLMYTLRAKD